MIKTAAEIKAINDTFVEMVKAGEIKEATVSANGYTRDKLREDSFAEKIITPIDINNDELDKAEDPEFQVKWNSREPDTAPAVTVPLGVVPAGFEFFGSRYPSYFARILSPMYEKDIDKLRGYDIDIRQIMLELSTKNMATEVDTRFMQRVNSVIGAVNTANPLNGLGLPQNITLPGGLNRDTLKSAFQAFKRLSVPFGPAQTDGDMSKGCMLMNTVTHDDLLTMNRSEAGGDLSEKLWKDGLANEELYGVKPVYTIKFDMIPDGVVYFFSSEEYFGKYYRLQPLTVFMEQKAFWLSFFQYMNISISIGNAKGVLRADFNG